MVSVRSDEFTAVRKLVDALTRGEIPISPYDTNLKFKNTIPDGISKTLSGTVF